MEKNYNIDDIENFLNQEMNADELAAFEKEMATDKALSEEVAFHDDVVKGIQNASVVDFKKMVGNVHQEMKAERFFEEETVAKTTEKIVKNEATVRSISMFRRLAIAASFALLLTAGWFMFSQPATPDQLFANNFQVHQDLLSTEIEDRLAETGFGTNKAQLDLLNKGIAAYNTKEYTTAISNFEGFEQAAPEDVLADYATFYKAISLVETNQLAQAQADLLTLSQKKNNPLINETRWNLALVYLKQNNTTAAKVLLQELTKTTAYQAKAEKVLKNL